MYNNNNYITRQFQLIDKSEDSLYMKLLYNHYVEILLINKLEEFIKEYNLRTGTITNFSCNYNDLIINETQNTINSDNYEFKGSLTTSYDYIQFKRNSKIGKEWIIFVKDLPRPVDIWITSYLHIAGVTTKWTSLISYQYDSKTFLKLYNSNKYELLDIFIQVKNCDVTELTNIFKEINELQYTLIKAIIIFSPDYVEKCISSDLTNQYITNYNSF